jgi:hypothetical protein
MTLMKAAKAFDQMTTVKVHFQAVLKMGDYSK